jgi:uncharacterized membrane protein YfcA
MHPLGLLFGAIVGLSLGLTGGGGAIFAVPLLVYGLSVPAQEAVTISLVAVGATSFAGFLHRWKLGEVEIRTGLIFAAAGMIGAPVGTWLASYIPDAILMTAFGVLMVIVAIRLWQQSEKPHLPITDCPPRTNNDGPTCQRDAEGSLILTSRCAVLMLLIGVFTGVLTGLFGVGGGFVIVPALVLFSSMPIQKAVGTSLMVIALVSLSGIAAKWWSGRTVPLEITTVFVIGGVVGLFIGQQLSHRISGPVLQKVFALIILGVAIFVVMRNL